VCVCVSSECDRETPKGRPCPRMGSKSTERKSKTAMNAGCSKNLCSRSQEPIDPIRDSLIFADVSLMILVIMWTQQNVK